MTLCYSALMINSEYFEKRAPVMVNLGFRREALADLKSYVDMLWLSNESLNLISRQMTFAELIDNHVIDCLLPLQRFPQKVSVVADFGSGGGLPGVIYAIQFPQIAFRLYEKSPMKQDFLRKCQLIAPNIQVQSEIGLKLAGVDLVTARAFKPIDVILDVSRDYYQKNGKYFLLKGRLTKIDEELTIAKKKFKNLNVQVNKLNSPLLEVERHLVSI
jgi:16S rRNA (guanine527-N7)-methyltransferase